MINVAVVLEIEIFWAANIFKYDLEVVRPQERSLIDIDFYQICLDLLKCTINFSENVDLAFTMEISDKGYSILGQTD